MPVNAVPLVSLVFDCKGATVTVPIEWIAISLATKDDGPCHGCGCNHSTVEAVVECPACGGTHTFELGADQEAM